MIGKRTDKRRIDVPSRHTVEGNCAARARPKGRLTRLENLGQLGSKSAARILFAVFSAAALAVGSLRRAWRVGRDACRLLHSARSVLAFGRLGRIGAKQSVFKRRSEEHTS